jgi:REP element-mobilizing transposase RayT
MPCYLFTYHTIGSWYPDRAQGYVARGKGILPRDTKMAEVYRGRANHETVLIEAPHQLAVIDRLIEAVGFIDCRLHGVATEATHIHVLVSWRNERTWQQNRASLKKSLTLMLKETFEDRPWFSENASRKRVENREHFDYLMGTYLPLQKGWKWREDRGLYL